MINQINLVSQNNNKKVKLQTNKQNNIITNEQGKQYYYKGQAKIMLLVPKPKNQQPANRSIIKIQQSNEARPQYTYSDKMTLKQYLQQKNIQRKLQFKALNMVRTGNSFSPMCQQKQYMFEKQVHQIKGFIKHVLGEGSLFNRFEAMLDNLYAMFIKEITVYYKLRVERQQKQQDIRIKEFREVNNKLSDYLKSCQDQTKKTQEKLQHIQKSKQFYQKQREKRLSQMKKKTQQDKRQAQIKQKQRIQKQKREKQQQQIKSKKDELFRANSMKNQLFTDKKIDRPDLKNLQEIQQYNKRKENIGKLSNIFGTITRGR